MALPYAKPDPDGSERARAAKAKRDLATEVARLRPSALTEVNGEEADHGSAYPANFTKGLKHDGDGLLADAEDYRLFVKAINSPERSLFETSVRSAKDHAVDFSCKPTHAKPCKICKDGKWVEDNSTPSFDWRGWESPRAGHVYELEGADAASVGMAPAPRVGSSELAAEMAEVYALALLRDVPFTVICRGGDTKLCPGNEHHDGKPAPISAAKAVELLNEMPYFSGDADNRRSSTPGLVGPDGLNRFERNRRNARGVLTPETVFRGSTPGAMRGPYISQFLLIGVDSRAGKGGAGSSFPGVSATFDLEDGYIPYGSLIIDQRTQTHTGCLDYMTDWCSWLDVQNGADTAGIATFEPQRRFITTPRDLATYVHYDALYEAYLNAALTMLALGVPASKGFPERSPSGRRTAFATFGGPHILSLVTEVASRCLKAVRRQKFNYHRRARPEALGGRLTVAALDRHSDPQCRKLGGAADAFERTLDEIPSHLLDHVADHNNDQSELNEKRGLHCDDSCPPPCGVSDEKFAGANYLLPMAFPEGSPMHPAYGAGHATVAGGCVTMLKAFFEMFEDSDSYVERPLVQTDECGENPEPIAFQPNKDGSRLIKYTKGDKDLTIQGELDKLAANISIGRNMAGVHYYSDYYDSLRMGERVAVSILLEQAPTYGDEVYMTFTSFDGDHITIHGEGGSCPNLSIIGSDGDPVSTREWWLRHVPGGQFSEDL
jgi:hypothetical protein